jgi:prevent-host-death family protein
MRPRGNAAQEFAVADACPTSTPLWPQSNPLDCTEFCNTGAAAMSIAAKDVVPFTQARATLSELADEVKQGSEKIITKNGESYVALIDSDRLDYYHRLERERIHLLLLEDVKRGLADIAAGRTEDADTAIARLQQARKASAKAIKAPKRRG